MTYLIIGKQVQEADTYSRESVKNRMIRVVKNKDKLRPLSAIEIAHICKDLSIMIKSGMSITDAIQGMMASKEDNTVCVLYKVYKELRKGLSFSAAVEKRKEIPVLFVRTVKVGEETGSLPDSLESVAKFYETSYIVKSKVDSSLIMPSATLVLSFAIFLFMLQFLFPRLETFAKDSGVSNLSGGLVGFFLMLSKHVIIVAVVLIILLFMFFRYRYKIIEHLPAVGKQFRMLEEHLDTYFISSVVGLGVNAGIGVRESILFAVENVQSKKVRAELEKAAEDLSKGMSIGDVFYKPMIPIAIRNIATIGEKTGRIGEMFKQLSDSIVMNIQDDIARIEQTLPTAMTLLLGVIVGSMLLAFYSTYFGIFAQLSAGMQ